LRKRKHQLNVKRKKSVHPQTLAAFVRESLAEGVDLPQDTFGVYVRKVTEIKASADLVPAMLELVERMAAHFARPGSTYPALPWPSYIPHFNDYAHLERVAEWSTASGGDG